MKMYLGLLWDTCTCKVHAKCQDTCILFECNRACKIRLGYIKIHQDTCILQDTRRIHQDTYPDNNPPQLDNKPPAPRARMKADEGAGTRAPAQHNSHGRARRDCHHGSRISHDGASEYAICHVSPTDLIQGCASSNFRFPCGT